VKGGFTPAPASVVADVTSIPTSVYNAVGVSDSTVIPPTITSGQKPLTFNGRPGVFYFGAEYCPYCAAERWAILASTARFGTWSGLGEMESSSTDAFPSTQTFTFARATFTSPYYVMKTREYDSNVPDPSGGYEVLQPLNAQETSLVNTYDGPKFFSSESAVGSFPFVDFGNKALISGASYSPAILANQSRESIAAGLDDPTDPITQSILTAANYMSASTCAITGQQPASVCKSKGVMEAAKKLGLS
jgi:thiol-disulfide isomerase/thioredoxin